MANDNFLKARMSKELQKELEQVIKEIQERTPEANVNASTIARYALEKYIRDHIAKRDFKKIFVEIDTSNASEKDIERFFDWISKAEEAYQATNPDLLDPLHRMFSSLTMAIIRYWADLKKANQ